MRYRYRPADNRTPVNDPVLGHLSYEGIYDDDRCAGDPRFVEVPDVDALGSQTRKELHELAEQVGVEDPEHLPNKQAVIDAITEATAAGDNDTPDEPDPDPDTPGDDDTTGSDTESDAG